MRHEIDRGLYKIYLYEAYNQHILQNNTINNW